jgi:hypothetical protein
MGNNEEIRKRMETYRSILLALNWIGAVILIIVGIVLFNSRYTQVIGIGVIIGSIVIGVIGHFLINVTLAIPFILLNNGDILESMKGNAEKPSIFTKKCPFCAENINNEAKICPHCGKSVQEYENEQKIKLEEEKRKRELEIKEKFKNIEDLFKDASIMEEANKLRRLYGKGVYVSHLKNKAKELGLGDIDLNENDIE